MSSPIQWNVVTIDTTEFWMVGGRYEHHLHDFRIANRLDAAPTIKADVVGRSCYGDRLLGAVSLPDVEVGDLFALLDTGACQEVSASNFNAMRCRPTWRPAGHRRPRRSRVRPPSRRRPNHEDEAARLVLP
jgi:hypothetical protein